MLFHLFIPNYIAIENDKKKTHKATDETIYNRYHGHVVLLKSLSQVWQVRMIHRNPPQIIAVKRAASKVILNLRLFKMFKLTSSGLLIGP